MQSCILSLLLIIGCFSSSVAQTHALAHKSHSGDPEIIDRSSVDRFGLRCDLRRPRISKIKRVQTTSEQSTTIYYGDYGLESTDSVLFDKHTIFNASNLNLDSLKASFPEEVIWIGFNEVKKELNEEKRNSFLPLLSRRLPKSPLAALAMALFSLAILISRRRKYIPV